MVTKPSKPVPPSPPTRPVAPRPPDARGGQPALPWWPAERGRAANREPLSREEIIRAALRILDSEGLDALSMRRLGRELGAGATSLYWHVNDKDELLDLVLDEVIGEVDLSVADPGLLWRERVVRAARELRRVLVAHRGVSQIFGSRLALGPRLLDGFERFITIFHEAGFEGRELALANQVVLNYATGYAVFEARGVTGPLAEGRSVEEVQALTGQMLAGLPAERFPTLLSIAADMGRLSADESFEYGLARILDGLELELERHRDLPPAAS